MTCDGCGLLIGSERHLLEFGNYNCTAVNERLTFCQGIPGLECDEPECRTCYPPAVEFEPADIP